MEEVNFHVGQIVYLIDPIDESIKTIGTIRLIEPDEENGFLWIYVRANDESLNINVDRRISGGYFTIIESTNPRLQVIGE